MAREKIPAAQVERLSPPKKSSTLTHSDWLSRNMPHVYVRAGSPVFAYEARSLPWGHTVDDLRRQTLRWLGRIVGAGVLLWLVVAAIMTAEQSAVLYDVIWGVVRILLIVSLLDRFVVDFMGVLSALDSVNKDVAEGRWDLICMTHVSTNEIVRAKYAVAQIRIWRLMTFVIGLRLTTVLLIVLTVLAGPLLLPDTRGVASIFPPDPGDGLLWLILVLSFVVLAAGYVLEPRWRVRALTSASVAVSSKLRSPAYALLSALGAVIGIWLTQITLLIAAQFALGFAMVPFLLLTQGLVIPIYIGGIIWVIYRSYGWLTNRWLDRAHERLTALGGAW